MKIPLNTLKSIRQFFDEELTYFYTADEIQAFFYLCAHTFLGLDKAAVILNPDQRVSESELLKFSFAVKDLRLFKPIQYVLGVVEFCGLDLSVTEKVLIPRPETEELTAMIIKENQDRSKLQVIDLCTGSGCIALALKNKLPDADVCGLDVSLEGLAIARKNATKLQLPVHFVKANLLTDAYFNFDRKFDVIVSNPPYVRNMEKAQMERNVLEYEPPLALFVNDEEPLIFYQKIADFADRYLSEKGLLYLEINEAFGKETADVFTQKNYKAEIIKDFRNKDRFLKVAR